MPVRLEQQLRVLAEHLPFDVWVRDRHDLCLYANATARAHWPLLEGRSIEDNGVSREIAARWRENNARALAGEVVRGEATYDYDGEEHVVVNIVAPVTAEGDVVGTVGVNIDITPQRRAESHLERGERLASIGTLAASIAHEIKNPAAATLLAMNLLRGLLDKQRPSLEPAAFAELDEVLGVATAGVDQIARLVRDLGLLARPTDDAELDVDVDEVVRSVAGLARPSLASTASLALELGGPPLARCNGIRLAQVVLNLLTNAGQAVAATGRRGNIVVVTSRAGDRARLEVSDDGVGVPASLRPRLFQAFATSTAQGSGLGLHLSKQIVERYRGSIEALEREGGGTTFRVELPLSGEGSSPP
jgi:PAS domain S-box-containing protein